VGAAAAVLVVGLGALLCKLAFNCGIRSEPPSLELERTGLVDEVVVSGLRAPTSFAFLPDGRILVAEVNGIVRVARDGKVLPEPLLDLRSRVNTQKTRGLVGLETDPDFAENGHVYLMYAYDDGRAPADADKAVRVSRFTARGDRADPQGEVVVLGRVSRRSCEALPVDADCIPGNGIHVGGGLAFAPDGTLFVATGDGEVGEGDVFEPRAFRAQDLDSLAGKVLHVTRTGEGVPANPFWTGDAGANRSKVWAYGLRNPFRLSLRPGSPVPYVGDVGWDDVEEIDVAPSGANLGWPCYEGRIRARYYRSRPVCRRLYARGAAAVAFPLVGWSHDVGNSVTGGVFRDEEEYVYGDFGYHWLRTLRVDPAHRLVPGSARPLASGALMPVQVRVGPDGAVYYLSFAGSLHRIRQTNR